MLREMSQTQRVRLWFYVQEVPRNQVHRNRLQAPGCQRLGGEGRVCVKR